MSVLAFFQIVSFEVCVVAEQLLVLLFKLLSRQRNRQRVNIY